MADEALASFNTLLENVPGWIADLENILKQAADRQQEILFESQPAEATLAASPRSTGSKSKSLKSSQSRKDSKAKIEQNENKPTLLSRPSLKHLTNSDALRLSQRKRKTASVASGDQSGPSKFRTKAAAVVYYDGDTQTRFEKLVRSVGTSRNAIRKGKMSAKVDNLARTGSSSSEASCSSGGEDGDELNPITARLLIKSTRSARPRGLLGRNDGTEAFDRVDGKLEKAQMLCERAAHQILRDGDCTLEVTNAKEHFSEALKMVEAEVPSLQKKAAKAAARRRRSAERQMLEEEAEARAEAEAALKRASDRSPDIPASVTTGPVVDAYPCEAKLEVDPLEVDDQSDDDGDGEFDISAMKLGRFAPTRRTPHPATFNLVAA